MSVYKAINAFPSYLFSDCGQVLSLRSGRHLSQLVVPNGYRHVVLVEGGVKKRMAVHRLIAEAFHGAPASGQVTNHKNGVKHANSAENLEWVYQSENVQHAYDTGLRVIDASQRAHCAAMGMARRKTSEAQEAAVREMFTGKRGDLERIAKAQNISRYIVARIIQGVSA